MSTGQLACTYACLLLHDDGIAITAEKIATVLKSAKVNVEAYWPSLFAKLCEKKKIEDLIANIGAVSAGPAAPAAAASGGAAAAAPAAEEKKEEPKEESEEEEGLFNLFD